MVFRSALSRAGRAGAAILCAALALAAAPPASDDDVREVASALIAPCCWTQQASIHQSPAARQMRDEIRTMLAAGRTRDEILQTYVARYGTRVLAEPPDRGFSAILHRWPWVTLAASAALLVLILRRTTRPVRTAAALLPPIAPGDEARLDEELRDLD